MTKHSKRWSLKDIKTIEEHVNTAIAAGKTERDGLVDAAKHFGLTLNALHLRWGRWKKGEHSKRLKKNTTKIPMKRKKSRSDKGKKRGPRKAIKAKVIDNPIANALAKRLVSESNRVVLSTTQLFAGVPRVNEVIIDFANKSVTFTY